MRRLTIVLLTLLILLALGSAVFAQQIHTVQRGQTLYSIARLYGRTVAEVAQANGLTEPYTIHAGNQLTIPARGRRFSASTGAGSGHGYRADAGAAKRHDHTYRAAGRESGNHRRAIRHDLY